MNLLRYSKKYCESYLSNVTRYFYFVTEQHCLFAVYIDSVIEKITASEFGCEINWAKVGILVYTDDIILLAPSLHSLQSLLKICETELNCLAMTINA